MKTARILTVVLSLSLASATWAQTVDNSFPHAGAFAGGAEYSFDTCMRTVWVADSNTDTITQYDEYGNILISFPAPIPPGSGAASPIPIGVAVNPVTGNLWIGDENEWVYEMTPGGVPTGVSWPTLPAVTDVSGLALERMTGNIFVSQDSAPQQIVEFTPAGAVVVVVPLAGAGSVDPDGLAYSHISNTFFLGEDIGDQIIEVDRFGLFLGAWAMGPLGISPEGVGVDPRNGILYIADGFGNTVWEVSGIAKPGCTRLSFRNTTLTAGALATLRVECATPGGVVFIGYSLAGPGPAVIPGGPCGPLTVLLTPPIGQIGPLVASATGAASFTGPVPAGTTGMMVWFQGFDLATCGLTNCHKETIL